MNWIKDNLIMLLAVLLGGAVIYATVAHFAAATRYAKLETELSDVRSSLSQCEDANSTANAAINELVTANESIAKQLEVDLAAAVTAAQAVEELAATLTARTAENGALRRRLAKENPDVAAHLATPVPCALARQLWPQAGYCPD